MSTSKRHLKRRLKLRKRMTYAERRYGHVAIYEGGTRMARRKP